VYVEKIELNGKPLDKWTLNHSDIINGGELKFYMSNKAKK
jgi:putative alpha-1,2-mannosidase